MTLDRRLRNAERELRNLLRSLDVPFASREDALAVSLGLRGVELYRGLMHACSGAPPVAAEVILRPIVDLAILTRWMELNPALHVDMWMAEDDRTRLTLGEGYVEMHRRRGERDIEPVFSEDQVAEMRQKIGMTREAALAAGEPIRRDGALLPALEQMANATADLFEIYQVAFRTLSPTTHAGGRSFVGAEVDERADGTHIKLVPHLSHEHIRALAVPAMLFLVASVSRQLGLGLEAAADDLRAELTTWLDKNG